MAFKDVVENGKERFQRVGQEGEARVQRGCFGV